MPLTLDELEALRAECFADDLPIEDRMLGWTVEIARVYFETAEEPPDAPVAPPQSPPAPSSTSLSSWAPPAPRDSSRKLRILCLHSFRTNGSILKMQMGMGKIDPAVADIADLVYLDAPYVCDAEDEKKQYEVVIKFFPTSQHGAYREWFNAELNGHKAGEGPEFVVYNRFESAIAHVQSALAAASPPFDGLMGFSQGGSLALHVATLQRQGSPLVAGTPPLRFVWLQSSRLARDLSCKGVYDAPCGVRAFVHLNEDDASVKPAETRALIGRLIEPTVVCSPKGGHSVMAARNGPEATEKLRAFLKAVE